MKDVTSMWRLREVRDNVTVHRSSLGSAQVAWYLLDPQRWAFRSVAEAEDLIEAQAAQLADLTGRTVHGRVTQRPFSVQRWAAANWANSPRQTPGALAVLERDQAMLRSWSSSEKMVYLGVDLGAAGWWSHRDRAAARMAEIDAVMAGPGLEAIPAVGDDMAWLLARSFALGCPVPEQDYVEAFEWSTADLAEFTGSVSWTAQPLADSVEIRSVLGSQTVVRHVVVLTVGPMAEFSVPESHEPWMSKTDILPFPVEWSWRYEVLTPEQTMKKMLALTDRIRAQIRHYTEDHDIDPPQQLERQADRAADVEDEMRSEFDGLATRTKGLYRLAVSAESEEEALARARTVIELFKPEIKVVRELDQYRLAREFVPGEPVANTAHTRHLPVLKVAAAVPAVTAEVGDRRGILLGRVSGGSQPVIWDPWFAAEEMESSGLVPVVGGLGAGKSHLGGGIAYKTCLQGVPWTIMDPSGLLMRLADLPDLRGLARVVTLLESAPGSLNPYGLVPDPRPDWIVDAIDPGEALAQARTAAAAQRRDLAYDTLRWCLPYATGAREDVQTTLRDAIHTAPAEVWSSPLGVLERLESGDGLGTMVARRLREASERELSRLFFPSHAADMVGVDEPDRRLVIYSLVGLPEVDEQRAVEEWGTNELLARPILSLAAWATLRGALLRPRHERKGILLDEMHEITKVGSGAALVQKVGSDNRKRNIHALILTQNASRVIGQNINNFVGAAFVGRTTDATAQGDACNLMGLPQNVGYESVFGSLSPHSRRDNRKGQPREFVFRDGMGGMEQVTIDFSGHPELIEVLNTTPDHAQLRHATRPQIEVA